MKKLSEVLNEMGIEFSFPIEIKKTINNKTLTTYYENNKDWYVERFNENGDPIYLENENLTQTWSYEGGNWTTVIKEKRFQGELENEFKVLSESVKSCIDLIKKIYNKLL